MLKTGAPWSGPTTVRIVTPRQEHIGTAVDVDADGALILETADGRRQRIVYGDCFHRGN